MGIEESVKNLIEKPILALGYTEVSVKYVKEFGTQYLRILVDRDDVIDLEDIVKVNDLVSPLLDEADLIQNEYVLDVTSFGAEKPIKVENLEKYVGKYVNVHLSNPYKGLNNLEGDLENVTEKEVTIVYKEKTRVIKAVINRQDIDKARLAIKF
jgi:ribosome maturation factor RimP